MNHWEPARYRVLWELTSQWLEEPSPDSENIFHTVYAALASVLTVDACYIAFYDVLRQTLRFAFNYDASIRFNDPLVLAVGDGPTSWVVRNAKSLVFPGPYGNIHAEGMLWGTLSPSASAVHAPIFVRDWNGGRTIAGVISIQSYTEQAYEADEVAFLEAVATLLGNLAERERATEVRQAWLELAHGAATFTGSDRERVRVRFEAILESIQRAAERLYAAMPKDDPELMKALLAMRRTFFAAFTEMRQALAPTPGQNQSAAGAAIARQEESLRTPNGRDVMPPTYPAEQDALTRREAELLRWLPTPLSYKQIAEEMGISLNTVEFHKRNLFRKLNINSRQEAVSMAVVVLNGIAAAPTKPLPPRDDPSPEISHP